MPSTTSARKGLRRGQKQKSRSKRPKRIGRRSRTLERKSQAKGPYRLGGVVVAARTARELATMSGASEAIAAASRPITQEVTEAVTRAGKLAGQTFARFANQRQSLTSRIPGIEDYMAYSNSMNSLHSMRDAVKEYEAGDTTGAAVGATQALAGFAGVPLAASSAMHAGLYATGHKTGLDTGLFLLGKAHKDFATFDSLRSAPRARRERQDMLARISKMPEKLRELAAPYTPDEKEIAAYRRKIGA